MSIYSVSCTKMLVGDHEAYNGLCRSTSDNKGIHVTTSVQCATSCKSRPPSSGLVGEFSTGLVGACVNLPRVCALLF